MNSNKPTVVPIKCSKSGSALVYNSKYNQDIVETPISETEQDGRTVVYFSNPQEKALLPKGNPDPNVW